MYMNKTIILGRDSYLSKHLKVSISNSKTYSLGYKNFSKFDFTNANIIVNSFYSSKKLNNINSYEDYIKRSLYELSIFLDKIKNKKIRKIIYTSSSAIYSLNDDYPNNDARNRKFYAATKLNAEYLIKNFCLKHKINFCIVRVFNFFGDNENFSVISKIIDAYKNKDKILQLINNGNSIRDFIHIDDIIKIYKKIIKRNNIQFIDACSGCGIKIKDIINFLQKKNFNLKSINLDETRVSIGSNSTLIKLKKNTLESFIKKKLRLKKTPKFKRFKKQKVLNN